MNIEIIDMFWDRIYLNVILQGKDVEKNEIFLVSKSQKIKLVFNKIEEDKYKIVINITNIDNIVMLQNDIYKFIAQKDDAIETISITTELGYKLETLDKIYRYEEDRKVAYTINFEPIEDKGKIICLLSSEFMMINDNYHKERIKGKSIGHIIFVFGKKCMNILYKIYSLIHFNKKNRILLMSETRAPITGNLKALDDRIKERSLDKKIKISYSFFKTLEMSRKKLIFKYLKLIWILSKQEIIFVDDYSPIFKFINLSKKTKLVQLWHAGVGFKAVGFSRFGFSSTHPYENSHRKYDYAVVGAESLIPVYAEVFGISKNKILPYGLPRLDDFPNQGKIEDTKQKIYSLYPILKGKNIILFAPTFRGKGQRDAYYPFEKIDLDKIYDLCKKNNYIFLIKTHPFVKAKLEIPEKYTTYMKDLSDYPDINELFYITDILITDYSSNIYDFSLLNKPIIFYTFDLDYYQIINKVHRPIKEYAPGKVCTTFEEVIETIKEQDFQIDKLKKFREENLSTQNKSSSDLIIDNIILKKDSSDI